MRLRALKRYSSPGCRKFFLLAALLALSPGHLLAGKLDLDYIKPSPTKAFMYSFFIPGGGYFYLSTQSIAHKGMARKGIAFFALGAAGYYFTASSIVKKHPHSVLASTVVLLTLKLWEFDSVIGDAEKERWASFKKYSAAQQKGTEDTEKK